MVGKALLLFLRLTVAFCPPVAELPPPSAAAGIASNSPLPGRQLVFPATAAVVGVGAVLGRVGREPTEPPSPTDGRLFLWE